MFVFLTSVLCISGISKLVVSQHHEGGPDKQTEYHLNSPPTVWVDRNWIIPDTTPIGTLIKRIQAADLEHDPLEFGLEHSAGFNIVESDPQPLPFRIDAKSGHVYTNQSLEELSGHDIYMYVSVTDGHQISKVQVWVKIENAASESYQQSVPYVPKVNFPNNGDLHPFTSFPANHQRFPTYPGNQRTATKLNSVKVNKNDTKSEASVVVPSTIAPMVEDRNKTSENVSGIDDVTQVGISGGKDVTNITKAVGGEPELFHESATKIFVVLLPAMMICISLLVSGIAACLFRRRMCKKQEISKSDEIKKTSRNNSVIQESMVMQRWIPRVQESRYDCDTDSNLTQVTSLSTSDKPKNLDKWEFARHHVKVLSILGEGCFGQVWKCEALNINNKEGRSFVAVKMLKENAGERERIDLLQELHIMKMLEPHPNVVKLLGCCTEKDPVFVIMEYVANGKLQSFLRHSRAQRYYNNLYGASDTLSSRDLICFCYQIAKGMQYLSSKGIIHRDIAARNILVSEDHTCKVADFGFARDLMTNHIYERKSDGRLPIRWMAPESLYDNIFSVKSDIWSYGVLVWEIVTLGSTPYPGISAADVMRRVRDGYRLEKPEHCRRELYNIMYYCWDKDPKERPNFSELVDLLEQLLLTETDYIQLERFPDHSYYNMVSLSGEKL